MVRQAALAACLFAGLCHGQHEQALKDLAKSAQKCAEVFRQSGGEEVYSAT